MVSPTRRSLVVGSGGLAAATLVAACTPGRPSGPGTPGAPSASTAQPVPDGAVEWWLDQGRYPTQWTAQVVQAAADAHPPLEVRTATTEELATQLSERMRGSDPPDLVLNGGPDQLGIAELANGLAGLEQVATARAGEPRPLSAALRPGTLEAGTSGGRLVALPSVLTVHGLWYSRTLFGELGWKAPRTWDELLALGEAARRHDMHLFCWGRDGATAYLRMVLSSAVKQGGDPVRRALDGLEPHAWSMPEVQTALRQMHQAVQAGHVRPGGSQRSWRSAMQAWSLDHSVAMVPCGSWITAQVAPDADFALTVSPDPAVGPGAAMGPDALHAFPEERYLVPAAAAHAEEARRVLRLAMERRTMERLAQAHQVVPVRTDAVPQRPGPVLARQLALLEAAGKQVFGWRFIDHHGTNHDHQALWNAFLEGRMDVRTLTRESQRISDLVAADPRHSRYPVR